MRKMPYWDGQRLWPEGKPSAPQPEVEEPDSAQVPKAEVKPKKV